MVDTDPDSIGPLWIRRQVFEHSVAIPVLTATTASQIDFPRLAAELIAVAVPSSSSTAPAVTYDAWVAAAGLHARLDSSEDAGIIIEALETNAPDAFVRCNDPIKLAPGRQLSYRQLLIPVPELLAFIKLHAAATISSRFRESADAVWPEQEAPPPGSPTIGLFPQNQSAARVSSPHASNAHSPQPPVHVASTSLSPASPRLLHHAHPQISQNSPGQPSLSPQSGSGLDGLVRKKTPTNLAAMFPSQSAIIASVQHAFQRETRLIVSNLKALLLIIASAYGVGPDAGANTDIVSSESGIVMGGGAVAVESGTLARGSLHGKVRRANSMGPTTDSQMLDEHSKLSTKNVAITRQMFEHLSFLLTTARDPNGSYRPVSWVVPQWRDLSSTVTLALGELTDTLTSALTHIPLQKDIEGSTDVAEIRDLDRKTILRSSIPLTNAGVRGYPHAQEIRISNCSESHFYLLCSLGRVSLIACRDCTLFVGACVSVSLINCVNVRVHAIARVCRVTNSFDTHLYLCTNRYPQIVGENRGLVFAPYNAAYDKQEIEKHLAAVGVDPNANVWDKFYRPAYRSSMDKNDPGLTPAVACILQPEMFLPFAVPIRQNVPQDGSDRDKMLSESDEDGDRDASSRALFSVPLLLPPAYQEQLLQKSTEISRIRKEIRAYEKRQSSSSSANQHVGAGPDEESSARGPDVAMSDSAGSLPSKQGNDDNNRNSASQIKKGLVQSLVQERFREWLNSSGRIKQINDLVRLDQET